MNAFCLIFSGMYNHTEINELSKRRTISSIPYGGRFRMIDFILSSLVKAKVPNIGIITRKNYKSLMDHLGWGKDWDLNRKNGGLKLLTPMSSAGDYGNINTAFEALATTEDYINSMLQDYCIIADANNICNIDFKKMLDFHIDNQADITVLYRNKKIEDQETEIIFDEKYRAFDSLYHQNAETRKGNVILRVFILKKELLKQVINQGVTQGWEDFAKDYISKNFHKLNVYCYEHKGYCATINSIENYYKSSMDLLKEEVRKDLFLSGTNVLTKIRDSVPTYYGKNSKVKNLISGDGAYIDGEVENSIIFRDVKIKKGAKVKNCILMQGTVVEENAELEYIITDRYVNVSSGKKLKADEEYPLVIPKNKKI